MNSIPTTANCSQLPSFDLPTDVHPSLRDIITDHKLLFSEHLGKTDVTNHVIDTGNATPIRVPPCPIPFYYVEKVHNQLQEVAQEGIIRPSNSPSVHQQFMSQRATENFVSVLTLSN